MRKWELIKQTIEDFKSKIFSNLFTEKYGLQLAEINNSTGTESLRKLWLEQVIVRCFVWIEKQNPSKELEKVAPNIAIKEGRKLKTSANFLHCSHIYEGLSARICF